MPSGVRRQDSLKHKHHGHHAHFGHHGHHGHHDPHVHHVNTESPRIARGHTREYGRGATKDYGKDVHASKRIEDLTHKVESLQQVVRDLRSTHLQEVTHLKMELVKVQRDSRYEPDLSVAFTPNKAACEETDAEKAMNKLRSQHVVGRMKNAAALAALAKRSESTKEELENAVNGLQATLEVHKMLAVALTILFDTAAKVLLAAAKRMGYENISQFAQRIREGQSAKEASVLDWMVSSRMVIRNTMHVPDDGSFRVGEATPPEIQGVNLDAAMVALKKGAVLTSYDLWCWPEDMLEHRDPEQSDAATHGAARDANLLRSKSHRTSASSTSRRSSASIVGRMTSQKASLDLQACADEDASQASLASEDDDQSTDGLLTLQDRSTSPIPWHMTDLMTDRASSPITNTELSLLEAAGVKHGSHLSDEDDDGLNSEEDVAESPSRSPSALDRQRQRGQMSSPRTVALLPGLRIDKTKPRINFMAGLEEGDAWAAGNSFPVPTPSFLPCSRKKTTKTVVVQCH